MSTTLLQRFIDEECGPAVRQRIQEALNANTPVIKRLHFNVFDVTIDLETGEVLIEDILEPEGAGEQRIPLTEFARVFDQAS